MDKQEDITHYLTKYKGIIFDLDGTLVDLAIDWDKLKNELSQFCTKNKIIVSLTPLGTVLQHCKKEYGEDFFRKLISIIAQYEIHDENYQLNISLLNYINSKPSQKIAIYSMNSKKCVEQFISNYLHFSPEPVIFQENCQAPKPTELDLLFILNQWKLTKEDVAFVGNSYYDERSGKMAGLTTYIVKI